MSLEARIARVVSAAGPALPAWGTGCASDAEWDSADDELRHCDGDDCEEEEEVVEMDEAEVMALLDADTPALQVCQRLFFQPPPPAQALQLLPGGAAERLRTRGWALLPGFLPAAEAAAARAEALALHRAGAFGAAAAAAPADASARGDAVMWLRSGAPPAGAPGLAAALAQLEALRGDVAQLVPLRADGAELQLAVYPPGGAAYARHRDAFPEGDACAAEGQRRVTAVLYANDAAWDCRLQGGALRLHVPPPPPAADGDDDDGDDGACEAGAHWLDVAPRGGSLLLFLSGAVDHEVRPSRDQHRVALTAWFR